MWLVAIGARGKTAKRFLEKDDSRKNLDKAVEKMGKKFRTPKPMAGKRIKSVFDRRGSRGFKEFVYFLFFTLFLVCDKVETPKSNRKAVKSIPKSSACRLLFLKVTCIFCCLVLF